MIKVYIFNKRNNISGVSETSHGIATDTVVTVPAVHH